MDDGFAQTHRGRIPYPEDGAGAPLALLHGNGASAWQYQQLIPLLAFAARQFASATKKHKNSTVTSA